MTHSVREDFAERVRVDQQELSSTLRPTYRNPDRLSDRKELRHSDGRLKNIRQEEIVVWILVVVLGVVTVTAFYLLWLKAEANQYLGDLKDAMGVHMYFPQQNAMNGLEVFRDIERRNK